MREKVAEPRLRGVRLLIPALLAILFAHVLAGSAAQAGFAKPLSASFGTIASSAHDPGSFMEARADTGIETETDHSDGFASERFADDDDGASHPDFSTPLLFAFSCHRGGCVRLRPPRACLATSGAYDPPLRPPPLTRA
ncbi:hypothetical protein MPC4_360009 [Methylocella tundrae]|uniref:Uncharacterized protein n=1 Tax=Methylocella tundrae TaxID=227605 RepID=A0A8B6M988_METTU|nr:hypothetical protein [Methylocella tundrae]VTZ51341.1 hypothetical protein MPC4_360009 [Methylocella tundrae]